MAKKTDGEYARALIQVLTEDCARMDANASWSSIVLWEAEQLGALAGTLQVPSDVAKQMRKAASDARTRVREVRARDSAAAA